MDDEYLASARAKLRWPERHWKRLNRMNTKWVGEAGQLIRVSLSEQRGPRGTRWSVAHLENELPVPGAENMSLVAGDFVHNTRTALDHLACACVRASGNQPTDQNAFPINERRPEGRWLQMFKAKVARMDRTYVEAITRLQPYENPQAPGSRHLVQLSVLDNLDKHKLLLPVGATGGPDPAGFLGTGRAKPQVVYNPGVRLEPGVELVRRRLLPGKGPVYQGETPFNIDLRFGANDIGLAQLAEIRAHVVGVVESFGPSFDG